MKYMPKFRGTFVWGAVYFVIGFVFLLNEAGVWNVKLQDLWILGPIALVLTGFSVIIASVVSRSHRQSNPWY